MAIRNLIGLYRAKTQAGRDCLRGKLLRDLVMRDPESGRESTYPAGSLVMLLKNDHRKEETSPEYHLAVIVDDAADRGASQHATGKPNDGAAQRPNASAAATEPQKRSAPPGVDEHQQARARRFEQQNLPIGYSPF